jgi:hypothetical protein
VVHQVSEFAESAASDVGSGHLRLPTHPIAGYVVAVLYTVVLVSLDNIQDDLENPFDGAGADDLRLDVADEYVQLIN